MIRKIILILISAGSLVYGQYNLNYFISKAVNNSPVIQNYYDLSSINGLQQKLDEAQNSAFQISLSSDVLFAPYFNNGGTYFTTNPGPKAIGYDAAVTNGGLYSAQINVDKNILNGGLLDALKYQRSVEGKSFDYRIKEEKHSITKQITDQYLNTLQSLLLLKLSKETADNLEQQLKITKGLVQEGYAKAQDYLLIKIEYKTQMISLRQNRQDYKSGLSQLYAMCGIKDTATVMIDTVNLSLSSKSENSNFLQKYYLDSLSTSSQQKIFETKYQPQVNLFFNAGLNAVELNDIQRKFGISAGINFSLPIFDGSQKDITRQQTRIAEKSISQSMEYLRKNIFVQRQNSKYKLESLNKNITDLQSQISDYKDLLEISRQQLQHGNLSMIEYLTLLKNYTELQKNKITTETNYGLEISNYNYWNW